MNLDNTLELTIAMPAFNEEASIEKVLLQVLHILDEMQTKAEVLVLDDCSRDRTCEIVSRVSARDPRVRLIRNSRNQGVAGFERRLVNESRGEWMFMGSSDGETDFADVPLFLKQARQQNLKAVFGYRQVKQYNFYRAFVSWSFNTLVFVFFGTRFRDAGWVKLLHVPTFSRLKLYSQSAFVSAERLLVAHRLGMQIAERSTAHHKRLGGVGSGGQWRWVLASFRDLLLMRLRWFRFQSFYGLR